ncbi:MAG: hypothetical protein RI894_2395 [Bacteroidota bacterium]|jgi:uncharacterized protein YdeI (YjbR/CyaY-like superfamily)
MHTFFATPAEFRAWLHENHATATELIVGFYKKDTQRPSMTWPESVDEALCYGWIDGVRRSIDAASYCIRFTPRKAKSIWSAVNIAKVETLIAQELMQPAGLASYEKRSASNSKIYAYEQESIELSAEFEALFKTNEAAWAFFIQQTPSYQKTAIWQIMSAKQAATQWRKLETLIQDSAEGRKIKSLNY